MKFVQYINRRWLNPIVMWVLRLCLEHFPLRGTSRWDMKVAKRCAARLHKSRCKALEVLWKTAIMPLPRNIHDYYIDENYNASNPTFLCLTEKAFRRRVSTLEKLLHRASRMVQRDAMSFAAMTRMIEKHDMKPIARPSDYKLPDLIEMYGHSAGDATRALYDAEDGVKRYISKWVSCYDQMTVQAVLFSKGKWSASAIDELANRKGNGTWQ